MPMIIIEHEEREEKRSPSLLISCTQKEKNTFNEKRIETKNRGDIVFFMRHVMSFVIDMFEEKKKETIDMKRRKGLSGEKGKLHARLMLRHYYVRPPYLGSK